MKNRKPRVLLTALLAALLGLAACVAPSAPVAPAPTPTPAPAAAPTMEPTATPAPELKDTEAAPGGVLTASPWQWVSFTSPVEQFDVEMPANYLLTFNADDTVAIVADCNNAGGSYTADAPSDGALAIQVGPMTLALCPSESRSEQFVKLLGGAARYFFRDGTLFIDLMADGGTMAFAPADAELMADDGEGALAGSGLPPAAIANDEGGPAVATGEWKYTAAAVATHYLEPVAMLKDVSQDIQRNYTEWVPRSGQIMGFLTRPLAPAPTAYQVNLPLQPSGASVDVDNDGETDAGVQVFAANLGTNLVGDSYLEQIEQAGFTSYLTDPQTGDIRQGALLVYAPDDAQGFPSAAGEDGVYFTADDPAVGLPAGWTLITLGEDGQVSFDRSREVTMNILEAAAYASPDFSKQGILESFNSLIDLLSVRYSYTELRGLDWEQIRQEYLPRVEAADAAGDFAAFYAAMNDLALSIKDAHVYLSGGALEYKTASAEAIEQAFGGGLGAEVKELNDGRVVVTYLEPEGPGVQAGWQVGTEIVSIDGVAINDRIDTLPILDSAGNPEVIRLQQMKYALAFPVGAETTIEIRQPEATDAESVTLTAVEGASVSAPKPAVDEADISFKALDGGFWYIQWKAFRDPLYKIAIWEKLLAQAAGATGIIVDMRHNGGGATDLMYTLASYLFTADDPAQGHWIDNYAYDEKVGDLVKEFATDRTLSSPRPELTFNGAVAVLVGEGSASAAEYLPQFLQRQGRAIVVGEHGTEGAGGYLEQAAMPGGFIFHFTKGRTFFAGTDDLNLEAKGVTLDVRVPISLENEQAKQEGRDVVLEAAVVALGEEAARLLAERLPGTTLQLITLQARGEDGELAQVNPTNPVSYTITFAADGVLSIKADCNQVKAKYTLGSAGAITITPGAATLALCTDDGLGERFVAALGKITLLQTDGQSYVLSNPSEQTTVNILMTPAAAPAAVAGSAETARARANASALQAYPWKWSYFATATEQGEIEIPASYKVIFNADGTVAIKADCNNAFGTYTLDGANITIEIGPTTLAACPGDSRGEQFLTMLGDVAQFEITEDSLFFLLKTEGSTMLFDAAPPTVVDLCGEQALALNTLEDTLTPKLSASLDEVLVGLVKEGRRPAPGASMLIITPQGRYFKSVGVSDVPTCEPLPADSLYQIGSNTKLMTSAILFQLQEEGKLSTSDLLSKWLPDLAAQLPNGDKITGDVITIDMLLTHTSGLPDYFDVPTKDGPTIADGVKDKAMLIRRFTPEELVQLVAGFGRSDFEPGAEGKWKYSNTGYMLLGLIIEKATGKSYEENLKARIFKPLGLKQTYLQTGQPAAGALPQAYYKAPFDFPTGEWNASQGWAAGAVVSTPEEFATFLKALFTGKLFRQPETLELMQQAPAKVVNPLGPGTVYAHGMLNNNGVLGHGGQTLGFQSDGGYVPDKDVTIVIWSNAAESNVSRAIVPAIAGMVLGGETTSTTGGPVSSSGKKGSVGDQPAAGEKPAYVTALEAAYGAPSQAGFGSAVFFESLKAGDDLAKAALAKYKYFTGELWERWGEAAWMGPWKEVYTRPTGAKADIAAELRGITDPDARNSAPMILDVVQDAEQAKAALAAAYDDPAVTELRVFNLGDGGAMSGILVAARRSTTDDATFLVFLLD